MASTLKTYTCLHYTLLSPNPTSPPQFNPPLSSLPSHTLHRPFRHLCPSCQILSPGDKQRNDTDARVLLAAATQNIRVSFTDVIERYIIAGATYFNIPFIVRARCEGIAGDDKDEAQGLESDVSETIQHFDVERRGWRDDPFFKEWKVGYAVLAAAEETTTEERETGRKIGEFYGMIAGILKGVRGLERGVEDIRSRQRGLLAVVRGNKRRVLGGLGERELRQREFEIGRMELRREAIEGRAEREWQRRIAGVEEMGR